MISKDDEDGARCTKGIQDNTSVERRLTFTVGLLAASHVALVIVENGENLHQDIGLLLEESCHACGHGWMHVYSIAQMEKRGGAADGTSHGERAGLLHKGRQQPSALKRRGKATPPSMCRTRSAYTRTH